MRFRSIWVTPFRIPAIPRDGVGIEDGDWHESRFSHFAHRVAHPPAGGRDEGRPAAGGGTGRECPAPPPMLLAAGCAGRCHGARDRPTHGFGHGIQQVCGPATGSGGIACPIGRCRSARSVAARSGQNARFQLLETAGIRPSCLSSAAPAVAAGAKPVT